MVVDKLDMVLVGIWEKVEILLLHQVKEVLLEKVAVVVELVLMDSMVVDGAVV